MHIGLCTLSVALIVSSALAGPYSVDEVGGNPPDNPTQRIFSGAPPARCHQEIVNSGPNSISIRVRYVSDGEPASDVINVGPNNFTTIDYGECVEVEINIAGTGAEGEQTSSGTVTNI